MTKRFPRPRFLGERMLSETNWGGHTVKDNGDIVCNKTKKIVGSIRGSRDSN